MPKGPKGEKRPGDVVGAAIMVAKIATRPRMMCLRAGAKVAVLGGGPGHLL
jgi:predicted Rossmann-fold nucleotide-binding protein